MRYERIGALRPGHALRPDRPVVVPGKSAGGPEHLQGDVVDVLIECERAGAATVLLASDVDDLQTPVAAVCRYAAAARPEVVEEAVRRFGAERVYPVESVEAADAGDWLGRLPQPDPGTSRWRRGVRTILGRIAPNRT
ncbi:hypothetical protein [Phytoactinopolyspora halotolerans]|uniref:Uncharacterized protein n=1 Tax=Phytoactinopolyspora halotolerans TaxID=1981512 RepID=A0A6L9SG44_9ACTN|nr:hypothetical protein [Phytoactinopolyspora halotolerans]NEE04089.1 hypothetical protein [Phytoactinopolyspora halotolerans]